MVSEHKVTEHLPSDSFDRTLSSMMGLPNGAHTKQSNVQHIDFYGNSTSYLVQTVRTDEEIMAFVIQVEATGSKRFMLPLSVLAVIDRQRESITTKLRSRHGKRLAEERKAAGIEPGFMKEKRRRKAA